MTINGQPVTWRQASIAAVIALWAWSVGFGMGVYAAKIGFIEQRMGPAK